MGTDFPGRAHDGRVAGSSDASLPHFRDERRKLPLPRVDESEEGEATQIGQASQARKLCRRGNPRSCPGGPTFDEQVGPVWTRITNRGNEGTRETLRASRNRDRREAGRRRVDRNTNRSLVALLKRGFGQRAVRIMRSSGIREVLGSSRQHTCADSRSSTTPHSWEVRIVAAMRSSA